MGNIRKLDLFTSNRIAAGEVVERPASAVKELIENSIDAGATAISVEISGGGIDLIRVTDNGSGMLSEDVGLAFERHATSKIAQPNDLDHIATLGFRGEALSSIAAIAQVELQTRTKESEFGAQIHVAGGEVQRIRAIGCPDGTSICVENLFFNTPVRREFLRKPKTEAGAVGDIVSRYILGEPSISFKYINDGKIIYHSPGDGDLRSGMYCIYGRDVLDALKKIEYTDEANALTLSGYVTRSDMARGNRRAQSFFVNGRYVQVPVLSQAIQEAYGTRLMGGRFPLCAIHLQLPFEAVDVNIHPHKMELRFKEEAMIVQAMMRAVEASLAEKYAVAWRPPEDANAPTEKSPLFQSTAKVLSSEEKPFEGENTSKETAEESAAELEERRQSEEIETQIDKSLIEEKDLRVSTAPQKKRKLLDDSSIRNIRLPEQESGQKSSVFFSVREDTQVSFFEEEQAEHGFPLHILGQAFTTYIIAERGDELFFVDQHAAHERMIYDEMVEKTNFQSAQRLIVPYEIVLDSESYALLETEREELCTMGFDFRSEDGQMVSVTSVPQFFEEAETGDFILEAIEAIREMTKQSAARLKRDRLASFACKHAIRGHDLLSDEQMAVILQRFEKMGEWNCPHGRPIVIRMSKRDLEKLFKRIV